MQFTKLKLNCDTSFLDPKFVSVLTAFGDEVRELENQAKTLILFECTGRGARLAFTEEDLERLTKKFSLSDLYDHLGNARKVLRAIRQSKHTWVYIARNDVIGFWTEFALACKQVFFTAANLRIGYPELECGIFPGLGSLEALCLQGTWLKKDLEQNPIINAQEASRYPWASLLNAHFADAQIEKWFSDFSVEKKSKAIRAPDGAVLRLNDDLYQELSNSNPPQNLELQHNRPWRIVWDAIRQKTWQSKPEDFSSLLVFQHARFLLSRVFIRWLSRYLLSKRIHIEMAEPSRMPIVIDLDYLAPPAEPMGRLLEHNYPVLFWGAELDRLKESLDLSYARFERSFGKERAAHLWKNGTSYVSSDRPLQGKYALLQWRPDDHVHIKLPDTSATVLRFNSNRNNSRAGWVELSSNESHDALRSNPAVQMALLFSEGLIFSKKIGGISLSCYIRSLFLQELVTAARQTQGGLAKLLPSLKDAGWGFIAEDNSWEYFLRAREEIYSIDSKTLKLGPLVLQEKYWTLGIFKEAKEFSRLYDSTTIAAVPAKISYHFAIFCGLLAKVIFEQKMIANLDEADLFVGEVLGFPKVLGTPSSMLEELGPLRSDYYWKQVGARMQ